MIKKRDPKISAADPPDQKEQVLPPGEKPESPGQPSSLPDYGQWTEGGVPASVEGPSGAETLPAKPSQEDLLAALQEAREEAKSARDRMLRVAADADNLRKRLAREREDVLKYGQKDLLSDLLHPLDNLERTLSHLPGEPRDPMLKSLREGLALVLHQLQEALAKHHLKSFTAVGEKFDPARHEALSSVETTQSEPGTVVSEMRSGYLLHDRLLRPALVTVARRPGDPAIAGKASGPSNHNDSDLPPGRSGTENDPTR